MPTKELFYQNNASHIFLPYCCILESHIIEWLTSTSITKFYLDNWNPVSLHFGFTCFAFSLNRQICSVNWPVATASMMIYSRIWLRKKVSEAFTLMLEPHFTMVIWVSLLCYRQVTILLQSSYGRVCENMGRTTVMGIALFSLGM